MREYDRELDDFEGRLIEFGIKFIPSYPFEEDVNQGTSYMQTRVPAWCDRVLMSPAAKNLVLNVSNLNQTNPLFIFYIFYADFITNSIHYKTFQASSPDAVEYGIIGPTTCMGDHKVGSQNFHYIYRLTN